MIYINDYQEFFFSNTMSWTHLRKIVYRKHQVLGDPWKILQSKGSRGNKSKFVQKFLKSHLKDQASQPNFARKTSIKN